MILCIKVCETDRPFDEGRSGETTEDQCHWLATLEVGQVDGAPTVHIEQLEIRGKIANFGCGGIVAPLPGAMCFHMIDCCGYDVPPSPELLTRWH